MDKAKNVRRAAKGTLSRAINVGKELIDAERPVCEVMEAINGVKEAYKSLEVKHEDFTMLLNDTEYNEAEEWMQACNREYMIFCMMSNDYVNANVAKNDVDVSNQANGDATDVNVEVNVDGDNEEANVDSENEENQNDNDDSGSIKEQPEETASVLGAKSAKPFSLKHEKPKLPKFDGDVRQYFIFKSDFQHAIKSPLLERDTLTILRSCLNAQPAKLIEGISSDLKTSWKYLDQNYDNPRVVSDTVTSDLERFKVIQPGEDHRFCDLVNLVRRFYNILKEIKRKQDIDNTHVTLPPWPGVHAAGTKDGKSGEVRSKKCYVCKEDHYVDECQRFIQMSPGERWKIVKDQTACFSCLKRSKDHNLANCTRKKECGQHEANGGLCKKFHHELLHSNNINERSPDQIHFAEDNSRATILPIVTGLIKGKDGVKSETNVLLDSSGVASPTI